MRKRFLCLSMACLISAAALAACTTPGGGSATPTPDNKPSEKQTEKGTEKGTEKPTEEQTTEEAKDLGGLEVVIGDWWTDPEAEPTSKQQKATKEFREENMEKYNYKVVQKAVASWGEFNDGYFVDKIMADDCDAQVYVLDQGFVKDAMNNNLFYDLATLDNLDLDDEKWNAKTIEVMTRGDHVYGLSIGATEPRLGVFFNKRIMKECGFDEEYLYDLQKDGKWTWDEYEKVAKACTKDKDGDGQNDVYASASFSADYFPAVTTSDNVQWISVDSDGHYVNNTTTAAWQSAMDWGVKMLAYEMPKPEGDNVAWDWFIGAFKDGQVAMTTAEEYKVGNWKDMEDDWGFVMFPYGPHADHCTQLVRENVLIIPSCYSKEEAENIAFVLDKYATPTPGYEEDDDWTAGYYNSFRDPRAVDETLTEMRNVDNQILNYCSLLSMDTSMVFDIYAQAATPAAKAEEIKDEWQAKLDEINEKF